MLTHHDASATAESAARVRRTGHIRYASDAARIIALLACVALIAGCAARRPEPVPLPPRPIGEISAQPEAVGPAASAIPAGARAYEIDAQRSRVTIKVHRAGPFAKLGHNHVVTSIEVTGRAWRGDEPAVSGFEIRVPVASLVVDEPAARAAAGPGFEGEVPQSAREGTYRNMMRPEVLDGANYPEVTVRAASLGGTWESPIANADITIRGATRRVEVPLQLQATVDALAVAGSFTILQSDFGITPFSVGGGAIQVADELELSFEIVATAR